LARIHLLDPRTAEQIAAGEVVERPASVVKELVENSLDAGAASIRVELLRAGLEEIRVLDDGSGMDREDLALAVKRHATSKIRSLEELSGLRTLGFRGEALPSIASVSQMILESSGDPSGGGHRLEVRGGEAAEPLWVGHPRGTTVTVRNLFFNTPARRKFLRSESGELEQVLDTLSRCALAHFDRRFSLVSDGRSLLDAPAAASRAERVRQIFGEEVARRLVLFDRQAGPYRASGFASRPDFSRSASRDLRLFLNGRPIRDRGLLAAVLQAYATFLPRGRYPFVLLLIEAPPERVDFNVHPTKWEVRFAEPRVLFELVSVSIRSAIQEERPVAPLRSLQVEEAVSSGEGSSEMTRPQGTIRTDGFSAGAPGDWEFTAGAGSGAAAQEALLFETASASRLIPLAQYRESYILASDETGLMIVDQHAAHERVLYEKLLKQSGERAVERQSLLFPVSLELDPERSLRLERGRSSLERLGFALESFGDKTWLVREIPALLGEIDVEALMRDLTDDLTSSTATGEMDRRLDRLAATTACHAAVKVNFPLTPEKMTFLLDELARTDSPMTCPHGRPVVLRISHRDLEKNFHRR
jgi:DNA mismatch repair protein MutL